MPTVGVQLALTSLLADRAIRQAGVQGEEGSREAAREPHLESALQALAAVGAVSLEEAQACRERDHRLQTASADETKEVRARLRAAATEFADELRRECSDRTAQDPEDLIATADLTLDALREIGLLTEDEYHDRLEELNRLLGLPDEPEDLVEGPQLLKARRVIAGPSNRILGMRLTAIALCDDGFVVHWHRVGDSRELDLDDEDHEFPPLPPQLEVQDDLGTDYDICGGGSGGGGGVETGDEEFEPAVPDEAKRLRVLLGDEAWEIPLA